MTDEEKKAIEKLEEYALCKVDDDLKVVSIANSYKFIILNLIKELLETNNELDKECNRLEQKEIEMQKVIELMAKDIKKANELYANKGYYTEFEGASIEYILNSYINKVKGE